LVPKFYPVSIYKNYFLLILVFLCSISSLKAQTTPCTPPTAPDFVPNVTSQCSGEPISFSITVPRTDERYVWDFGDTKTLTTNSATVSHTYQEVGTGSATFSVSVYSVNTLTGCSSAPTTKTVTVRRQVAFTTPAISNGVNTSSNVCVTDTTQNINVTATLTNPNTNTTGISGYEVNWGNGETRTYTLAEFSGTATISNPTAYNKEGAFPITVTGISSDPANACSAKVTIPFSIGRDPKAIFSADDKERMTPQIACGVPVRVELKNESTGGGLTYKWEVTNSQPGGSTNFSFIEGTSDTTKNPVLQFNEKGQYTIKLSVKNACVSASDTIGPIDPFDPDNPDDDFDEDGKYVQEETVLIVYPQVQLSSFQTCEDLVAGQPLKIMGSQLGQFDLNLGTLAPGSIQWVVTGGATISDPKIENPEISFPGPGTYEVSATFANECENSKDAPGASQRPPARIVITARPPKPADGQAAICAGDSYTIEPGGASAEFAFYNVSTGGTALEMGASYETGPLTAATTFYIAAVVNGCESRERSAFVINVRPGVENNTIESTSTPREVCVNVPPTLVIVGSAITAGTGTPTYRWESSTASATTGFATAPGISNDKDYAVQTLSQNTWFRRIGDVTGSCKSDTSAAVLVTVTPAITNNVVNIISGAQPATCEGSEAPRLIGSSVGGSNVQIIWESSTSGATAGFAPTAGANNLENYTPGVLTQTTWFRRRVTSGGCTDVTTALQISVNPNIANNTVGSAQTICSTAAAPAPLTGSIPTGGTGTYTYLWESSTNATAGFGPAAGTNTGQTYSPGTLTQPITYFRRVVTSGACEPNISEVVAITVTPAIENNTITAATTVVCEGTVPVLAGSTPTGGTGTPVYLWESSITSATTGFNPAVGTNNTKDYTPGSIVQNTWYRRTVTSAGSDCAPGISNVIGITIDKLPVAPTVEAASVRACAGTSATLRVTSTSGTYQWFTTATGGTPVSYEAVFVTPVLTNNTTYYVQATNSNQCVSLTRTPVNVAVTAISASAGQDTTIIEGQVIGLQASGGTTYLWSPDTGLNNPNIASPIVTPTKTTTYQVTVTTEEGCTATDEVTITVIPRVVVVNTFSPNGDNINDTWEIRNIENYPGATVEIFNRWGNPVFKSDIGYRQPWDGTFKGSILPLATYYYIIRLDATSKPISGSITLIR